MNKEFEEFINVKKSPISNCLDLSRYFIGRHNITPVYLTPQFEKEFNSKMYELEKLTKENQQLKEQLNKYTDPKDLTLMFMYCDEKAKDKIKCLEQENQQLKEKLEQKEDIIDKVIKWIENDYYSMNTTDIDNILAKNSKLLQIRKFLKGDK